MSLKHCECNGPGHCPRYNREMTLEDWDICRGAVWWLKERKVTEWMSETRSSANGSTGCIFANGPALDEHGFQVVRRTCGCGGQRAVIPMINCLHPSHTDPMPDDCAMRCSHFKSV